MINPGEQSAVEIPAKLLIANSSAAGGAGAPVVDVGEAINAMRDQMAAMQVEMNALKSENNALKLSNLVYGNEIHPGGDLDFTPGSASLALLEQALVGVKVFLSTIYIKGTDIQGSVVSRLLKDVISIGGSLYCEINRASFKVGDADLVFESLASVTQIRMYSNDDVMQRFTGASFPALTFVSGVVKMDDNPMLETIFMPNLVGVGGTAYFNFNPALTSLHLPSLVTVGNDFYINDNPSLAADKVQVSQDFESTGSNFHVHSMMDGFECTAGNGLSAVVAAVSSTSGNNDIASCKK